MRKWRLLSLRQPTTGQILPWPLLQQRFLHRQRNVGRQQYDATIGICRRGCNFWLNNCWGHRELCHVIILRCVARNRAVRGWQRALLLRALRSGKILPKRSTCTSIIVGKAAYGRYGSSIQVPMPSIRRMNSQGLQSTDIVFDLEHTITVRNKFDEVMQKLGN